MGAPPLASIGLMQFSGSYMGYIEGDPRRTALRISMYRHNVADPLNPDPRSGMEEIRKRDSVPFLSGIWGRFYPGFGTDKFWTGVWNKYPGSATLDIFLGSEKLLKQNTKFKRQNQVPDLESNLVLNPDPQHFSDRSSRLLSFVRLQT